MSDRFDRYSRQMRFAPIGQQGQARLAEARVLVCGCGALGSAIANTLVRSGVGCVRIVDRDFLELSNLQRQLLFDESDVAAGLPKAIAAAEKLRQINSQITIEPVVADITHKNIADLAGDVDLLLDGSDNFELRFLLNDYALSSNKPWIYGGAIGGEGQSMTIVPGRSACLACLLPEPPPSGATPTCDTAGILGPALFAVAAMQSCEALKLLTGNLEALSTQLAVIDLWSNRMRQVDLSKLQAAGNCRACCRRDFFWLDGRHGSRTAVLCGRNAVQFRPATEQTLDLAALASQLEKLGEVMQNDYLLRLDADDCTITLFPDGRAVVAGTDDVAAARTLYARYIGA